MLESSGPLEKTMITFGRELSRRRARLREDSYRAPKHRRLPLCEGRR